MQQDQRLRKARDFVAVLKDGRRWSDRWLVLAARPNGLEISRFGFSVSRRLGKAVLRNRLKRRLREAASKLKAQEGWDMVFIARKDAGPADYSSLSTSVASLLKRAGILSQGPSQDTEAGRLA